MSEEEKKENLTSEDYRQKADEHMDALKHEWSVFGKTGIIILAALFAIIIACIAWFASNREVSGTGMSVQSAGSDFELAAEIKSSETSETGAYDELLDVSSGAHKSVGDKSFMATDGSHTSIKWAINSDSNMGNTRDKGLDPGSSGELTFYIIAQKDGPLTVTLDLALTGYKDIAAATETGGSVTVNKLTDSDKVDDDVQQLLEGHILLFAGYDPEKKSYSGWISEDAADWTMTLDYGSQIQATMKRDGTQKLTWTADVEKGIAYPVTIYWIWPEVLGSYLLKNQTENGGRPVLFPKNSTEGTVTGDPAVLPTGLYDKMCTSTTSATVLSNRYFKWTENSAEFYKAVTPDILTQMRNNFNTITYGTLCSFYNAADQYLGENTRYVELKLDAQ